LVLSEGPNDLTGKVKAHAGHVLVIPIPPVSTTKADKQVKTFSLVSVELSVPIERFLLGYGSRSHIYGSRRCSHAMLSDCSNFVVLHSCRRRSRSAGGGHEPGHRSRNGRSRRRGPGRSCCRPCGGARGCSTNRSFAAGSGIVARRSSCSEVSHVAPPERPSAPPHP
jgi:hypothetical protein